MTTVTKINTVEVGSKFDDTNTKTSPAYRNKFFWERKRQTKRAASHIIPKVLEVIQPGSVIDVGCGTGEFLATFQEHSIEDIMGIDGDYVQRNLLAIPQEKFMPFDLNRPFTLDSTYDLAVCLEVAEHLRPESARDFIASLTSLAPIILFSAAIPYQGGTHHLNERWAEYWADLFKVHGFVPVDALRRSIWDDREIPFCYRQNMLIFCTEEVLTSNEKLASASKATNANALSIVHPEMYQICNTVALRTLRHILTPVLTPLWIINEKVGRRFGKRIINEKR